MVLYGSDLTLHDPQRTVLTQLWEIQAKLPQLFSTNKHCPISYEIGHIAELVHV